IKNEKIINNGKNAVIEIIKNNKDFFNDNDRNVYEFLNKQEFTDEYYIKSLDKYVPFKLFNTAWSKYFSFLQEVFNQCFFMIRAVLENNLYN
ncbi:MAG: hypothetical protein ACYDDE_00790, partial [bacterium]